MIPEPGFDLEARARPGIRTANALFLLAGAGLVLLSLAFGDFIALLKWLFGELSFVQRLAAQDALYYPLFVLLPCAFVLKRRGAGAFRLNGLSPSMALLCVVTAVASLVLANSVVTLWTAFLRAVGYPVSSAALQIADTNELLVAVFAIAVVPGILEELLFRGAVLPAYERGGTKRAIWISSLLFAALHGSVEGFPAQLIMGLVLGVAVVSTDSLYAGLMIHTAYNALVTIGSYLYAQMRLRDEELIDRLLAEMSKSGKALDEATQKTLDAARQGLAPLSVAEVVATAFRGGIALLVVFFLLGLFRAHREKRGIVLEPRAALRLSRGEVALLVLGLLAVGLLYFSSVVAAFARAA